MQDTVFLRSLFSPNGLKYESCPYTAVGILRFQKLQISLLNSLYGGSFISQ